MKIYRYSLPLLLAAALFVITGCNPPNIEGGRKILSDTNQVVQIDNVVRVFMHKPEEFTILSQPTDSKRLVINHLNIIQKAEIFVDVPAGNAMWAKCQHNMDSNFLISLEIHIHGVEDINGAGWETKNGKQTVTGTVEVVR